MDANQYVADEDDNTYSCRVSGKLYLSYINGTSSILNPSLLLTNEICADNIASVIILS